MKKLIVLFLAAILLQGCSQMASQYGFKPAVTYDIRGKVEGDVYTSIEGTFQIRMPPLLKPGAKIHDEKISDKLTALSLSDDLCREYVLIEATVGPEESLDGYVENYLNNWTARSESTILERKKMDTAFGGGVYFLAKVPKGAPCMQITFADGKQKGEKPDSENAMLFIRSGSRIYHFSYVLGPMADWPMIKTSPGEEVLMDFVSGFKPLK